MLVSSDVAFGLTRMIELTLDDVITIAPFRDIISARTWLAKSRAPRATAPNREVRGCAENRNA